MKGFGKASKSGGDAMHYALYVSQHATFIFLLPLDFRNLKKNREKTREYDEEKMNSASE